VDLGQEAGSRIMVVRKVLLRVTFISLVALVTRVASAQTANQVIEQVFENWHWTRFWFGRTGVEGHYEVGKRISALVFWETSKPYNLKGLCSTELSRCVAYAGRYLAPYELGISIESNSTATDAFRNWVNHGFSDGRQLVGFPDLTMEDFKLQVQTITLPLLVPPPSVLNRTEPPEAFREAERIRKLFGCTDQTLPARLGRCTGSLVFAYYGERDPYWFVLRSCSANCKFKGESVEMLTRGDNGWEVTSGGLLRGRKSEIERFKTQILRAEMFRLQL
jgi:hypothetical protein